jgi:hypothetical protein
MSSANERASHRPGGKGRDLVQVNPVTFSKHGDNG